MSVCVCASFLDGHSPDVKRMLCTAKPYYVLLTFMTDMIDLPTDARMQRCPVILSWQAKMQKLCSPRGKKTKQ